MEKRPGTTAQRPAGAQRPAAGGDRSKAGEKPSQKRMRKLSEYGKQLQEKQKVKEIYGMREAQFRRFFSIATRSREATGESLLSLLERRLDNVIFRLKVASTRLQARQMVVHGHIRVNGKCVHSPSFLVSVNDVITLSPQVLNKAAFLEQVIDKRLQSGKAPEWIELNKNERKGIILRLPVRADIQTPIEEHLIVELYSKIS